MKTPLPSGSTQRSRFASLDCKRWGIVLVLLLAASVAHAVNVPTLTPDGATFTTFQSVTVACTTPDALIRYTTDGSDPTTTTGTAIAPGGTIQILGPLTLKVKAFLNTEVSAVKSSAYKITGHVSTSGSHTLVLRADGTVWATGLNSSGQLGDGTTINRIVLTQVPGLSDVVAVAAGGSHSLALMRDGTVKAWGANTNSQCGTSGITPHAVAGLANVTNIAAGLTHSVARTSVSGGVVYTWGGGANGQQGNGSTSDRATPGLLALSGVKDIASGGAGNHTLALMNAGTVKCWGSNSNGQCGSSPSYSPVATPVDAYSVTGIAAIAAGTDHSLAVTTSGTVYGWGGTLSYNYSQPALIPNLTNIRSVAAGYGFTLAVKTDNSVLGLGSNYYGGLGIGAVPSASSPVALTIPTSVAVLAAGGNSTVAIKSNGNVFAWGSNSSGALGFGTATQKNVPIELLSENLVEVSSVAAGGNHNLITHADMGNHANDTVLAWGSNSSGQLGAGNTLPYAEPHLITGVTPLFNGISTAAGIDFSLVLRGNGTVAAAGQNSYGVLGLSTNGARSTTFIPVSGLPPIVSLAAGRWHALAVGDASVNGQVYAWGLGSSGQLGNGTTTFSRYVPVTVSNLTNVSAVAAGQYHNVARKSDGTVWAWGSNSYGQVGDSTNTLRTSPVQLPGLSGSLAIAAGLNHSLAVTINHTVAAWGYNSTGQLGDNTTTNRTTPIILPTLTGVVQVAAGYGHSLALKDDGTVWAWGRNVEGQLGDATNTQRNVPGQVVGLSGIVAIAAGDYHNLARKADGGVASWGANNLDQLGTGLSTAQLNPLIVPGVNVLHGASGVNIDQPTPDTYGVGEPFTLRLTLNPFLGRSIAKIAYFSDGFPLALADDPGTYIETIYPSVTESTARFAGLSSDTWGDLHITATSFDEDDTPSFPSQPVTIHILPPIYLTATLATASIVRLTWTTVPGPAMTFRIERRLPGENPTMLVNGLSALSYSDTPTPFSPEYLYRVIGYNGAQKVAVSAETQVTFTDTDGDGLPNVWEAEWGLNPNLADASFTWLVGAGLSAHQLFAQGAKRVDYPATALQWDGKKRLHAYHYLAVGGGNGVVWQDWEGDAVYSANVIVEQEVSEGVWRQVGTAAVSDWAVEMPPSVTSNNNFRLRGEVSSCETECKVRLMMRTALVDRHKPGFVEFAVPTNPMPSPIKRYYSTSVIHESWSTDSVNTQGRSWDWKDTTVNLGINTSDGSLAWDETTDIGGGTSGTHPDGSSNGDSSDYTHSDSGWGSDETPRDGDAVSSFGRDGTDNYSHSWLTGSSHGSGHTGAGGSSTQPFHLQFDAGPPVWESRYYDFNSEVDDYYSSWSGSFTGPAGTTTWSGNNTDYPGGDGPSQWPSGIESDSGPTTAVIHSGSGANTYEYTANLSGEYTTQTFLAATLASMPDWVEPPGGKRDTTGNTWTVSMHDLGFAGVETPALLPAVGGYRMTSERFLSEDESSLYALRSQYAVTCNDCEPQPTVIFVEYRERYAPGTREVSPEPGAQQIVEPLAITPGATPGKSQTTPVKTSDLTEATENGKQGLGRPLVEVITPVEDSDSEGYSNDLTSATSLRIGRMGNSLDQSNNLHIDKDPDRFFIRIRDIARSPSVTTTIKVKISTIDNPDKKYNDNPTLINLVANGNDFVSKSLLLVADDKDDDHTNTEIGADDTDDADDRTLRVQLGGKFKVNALVINGQEFPVDITVPVPARRRLTANFLFLGDAKDSAPQFQRILEITKERYGQIGVDIVLQQHNLPVPNGVDPKNVGKTFGNVVPQDVKKIVDAAAAAGWRTDVLIVAVPKGKFSGFDDSTAKGIAFIPKDFPNQDDVSYINVALISVQDVLPDNRIYTVAHELGHILNNENHYGDNYSAAGYGRGLPQHIIAHNLMKDRGTSENEEIGASKRLYKVQQERLVENLLQKLN